MNYGFRVHYTTDEEETGEFIDEMRLTRNHGMFYHEGLEEVAQRIESEWVQGSSDKDSAQGTDDNYYVDKDGSFVQVRRINDSKGYRLGITFVSQTMPDLKKLTMSFNLPFEEKHAVTDRL